MALLNHGSPPPTSAANPQHRVTGQYLARAHLDRQQWAKLAADLSTGVAEVSPLTVKQAAAIARVPVSDITKHRHNSKHSNGRSNGGNVMKRYLHQHYDKATGVLIREQVLDHPFPKLDPEVERVKVTVVTDDEVGRGGHETLAEHIARSYWPSAWRPLASSVSM